MYSIEYVSTLISDHKFKFLDPNLAWLTFSIIYDLIGLIGGESDYEEYLQTVWDSTLNL